MLSLDPVATRAPHESIEKMPLRVGWRSSMVHNSLAGRDGRDAGKKWVHPSTPPEKSNEGAVRQYLTVSIKPFKGRDAKLPPSQPPIARRLAWTESKGMPDR